MECLNCNNPLPETGFFCPNCSKQFKCKSCGELLVKDAKACIFCGTEVGTSSVITKMNTIEYSETKNTKNFKANFTDTVGQSISDSFGIILANRIAAKKPTVLQNNAGLLTKTDHAHVEEAEEAEVIHEPSDSPELDQLKKILKDDGSRITLSETRLKATSKRDYGKRLSIVFLFYKSLLGIESVPRKELTAILQNASVEDANLRFWLGNNPLIGINGDVVELKAPGHDAAKKFLKEIANVELKDKWQIGTPAKTSRKSKDKKDKK